MSIISLENLLKSTHDEPLEQLVRRAGAMERLAASLRAGLDAGLAPHLAAANLRADGELVVVAESPGWAARLRFETDRLMEIAAKTGAKVSSCRIVVAKNQRRSDQDVPQA